MTIKDLSLAALLIASAAFVACSSSDETIIDQPQPVNPMGTYTMTIKASKGSDAVTRALSLENSTLNATWAEGEEVTVYKVTGDPGNETYTSIGTLTAQSDGTTLSGTITAPDANDKLALKFLSPSYSGQDGTLNYIATHCDYAVANVTVTDVDNETGAITVEDDNRQDPEETNTAIFVNQQAIAKFTLVDKADGTTLLNASRLSLSFGFDAETTGKMENFNLYKSVLAQLPTYNLTIPAATYTTNGNGVIYLAIPDADAKLAALNASIPSPYNNLTTNNLTFTLTAAVGINVYKLTKTGFPFENGKFYDITVKMTQQPFIMNTTDNVAVEKDGSGEYSLGYGKSYTISGTGSGTINGNGVSTMTFADGTLFNGNICLYDRCNFILEGNVTVNGNLGALYPDYYSTISSSGGSHTLTVNSITGEWMLDAGVKLCVKQEPSFTDGGYIHDVGGNNIAQTTEEIDGVTYYVYDVPASTIAVGIIISFGEGTYTAKFYNNSGGEVGSAPLRTNGGYWSYQHPKSGTWFSYYVYTTVAPAGATRYGVYRGDNNLTGDYVDVFGGPILIEDDQGHNDSWGYKNW